MVNVLEGDIVNVKNDLSNMVNDLEDDIVNVKNDLSNMVTAPIGTILGQSPVPEIGSKKPVPIPKCWVPCDGSIIKEGTWTGKHSPDLNKAKR